MCDEWCQKDTSNVFFSFFALEILACLFHLVEVASSTVDRDVGGAAKKVATQFVRPCQIIHSS